MLANEWDMYFCHFFKQGLCFLNLVTLDWSYNREISVLSAKLDSQLIAEKNLADKSGWWRNMI